MLFKVSLVVILIPVVFAIDKTLVDYAIKQYTEVTKTARTGVQYPSVADPNSNVWQYSTENSWTAGFYPGILWYLYNYTLDNKWKYLAIEATDGMFSDQFLTTTHDIGFMITCSYGKGYDFTKNASYPQIIANAAHHLATRYSPIIGCVRSWNDPPGREGEFLVIVDNMMNLELLFRGYEITGNKTLYDIAVSHAYKTIKEHLRKDYSSFHVVAFNESDGTVIRKYTAQGYADWSCWSRGQSWLINGFTTTYGYTKNEDFLEAAKHVSNYYIDNLPEDGIAYWDFNVPKDKYEYIPRDTSSAAIAAAGLYELFKYTKTLKYLEAANRIMDSLSSAKYRADGHLEYKIAAILTNATTSGPNAAKGRSDLSLIYGDYYFVKALKYMLGF